MKQINLETITINELGLYQAFKPLNAHANLKARVFQIPNLENVYIMESDLYGNEMPKGTCFLIFNSRNGLIGTSLLIETLRKSSIVDIRKIVDDNNSS
jgi:hypothetical protein